MKNDISFIEFDGKPELQAAAAQWILGRLEDAIQRRGLARFYASGGGTPVPIYEQMRAAPLSWKDVHVGLGDERWVDEDHPRSNAAMVRRTLLQDAASDAHFLPMKTKDDDPFKAIETVNARYRGIGTADVMMAGMGPDSHTLSWFPGGRGYDAATDLQTKNVVTALEAIESDVTGPELLRMTLTYPVVANARAILLLITGAEKRHVFESASPSSPIGALRQAAGDALTVFYCD